VDGVETNFAYSTPILTIIQVTTNLSWGGHSMLFVQTKLFGLGENKNICKTTLSKKTFESNAK